MNIFHTSDCPTQSAKSLVDRHCHKMILESAQMLCTTYHLQGIDAPYKPCHQNHPSTKWVRSSYDNFLWLIEHAFAIAQEYTERYDGKIHKSQSVLEWCEDNMWQLGFDSQDLQPFAIAIGDDKICRTLPNFDSMSPVQKYREYYIHDKRYYFIKGKKYRLHQWKQNKPDWIPQIDYDV